MSVVSLTRRAASMRNTYGCLKLCVCAKEGAALEPWGAAAAALAA